MDKFFNLILGIPLALAQTTAADKAGTGSVSILATILQNLPLWITAIVVFILSIIVGFILKNIVENRLAKNITEEHEEILIISGRLTFVGIVIIGGSLSLAVAGINITNLIAAIGFGISFGLQDTIANFVAGIALLGSKPFGIGDWISINGKKGKVTKINIRATYLDTYDGVRLIVPNSQLYKSQVLSYTSNPMRRMKVPAYTRYGIDMQQAFTICLNVVKSHLDILLQPKANVVVTEMGDYYVALEVRFWVDSKGLWRRIESKVFMEIQDKLQEAGIDSPYPTNALTFDTDDDQVLVKTHALAPEEVTRIMKARQESEAGFTKRREELLKPHFATMEEVKNLDQSGAAFLKISTTPYPTMAQTMEQSQPVQQQEAPQQQNQQNPQNQVAENIFQTQPDQTSTPVQMEPVQQMEPAPQNNQK